MNLAEKPDSPPSQKNATLTDNGAEEARTPDLLYAIQALSQLSYSPDYGAGIIRWLIHASKREPLALLNYGEPAAAPVARRNR